MKAPASAREHYTLGYGEVAMRFVGRRTLESHGAFFIPYLREGMAVLDCGCGPGSMTFGLAERIGTGTVIGVDMDESQIQVAAECAVETKRSNASFQKASVYALPFSDGFFDAVFSHALFEHLADPLRAARECLRVLKPGGVIGVATPDWGGFLVAPASVQINTAIRAYEDVQNKNGGNSRMGRELGSVMTAAGFGQVKMNARYENYSPLAIIGDLMVYQFERDGIPEHASTMRRWLSEAGGMFAQAWVWCVAQKK
jgi:ubiquinone/menaquinone biosynthesis C-methylase UbiE